MPLSCSLFQSQSAGTLVSHPWHIGCILDFSLREIAAAHKGEIHASPIGGRSEASPISE